MGLLDKAGGFAGRFKNAGEETVRMMDYDSEETPKEREPKERKKIEKAPRRRLSDLLPKKGSKEPVDAETEDILNEEPLEEDEELELAYKVATSDTAFDIEDDEDYFGDNGSSNVFEDLPEPVAEPKRKASGLEYDDEKIKDVLEVLKIPATYVIASDVLMPDDFKKIEFDLQVPQGYDIGQVEFFVERAEDTVKEYLSLLEQRNDHIAKLATTVDRLQVDLENLKFDSQIAAGIGIMPTSDNDELERDNMELRLQVKRLEDSLKNKTSMPDLTSKERELYEDLRNSYSILEREKSSLESENSDLRAQIARMEEEQDEPLWDASSDANSSAFSTEDDGSELLPATGGIEYMDEVPREPAMPDSLPDFTLPFPEESPRDETEELPDFSLPATAGEKTRADSSFELADATAEIIESPSIDGDTDEDDELAKLMKGWS